jgi:hypothetical protein
VRGPGTNPARAGISLRAFRPSTGPRPRTERKCSEAEIRAARMLSRVWFGASAYSGKGRIRSVTPVSLGSLAGIRVLDLMQFEAGQPPPGRF